MENNVPQNSPAPAASPTKSGGAGGLAITALVMGIIAFLSGWTGAFGLLLSVIAIVFGILGLVKHQNKGMSIAGLILGGLALLAALFFTFIYTVAIFSAADQAKNDTSSDSSLQQDAKTSSWNVNAEYKKIETGMTQKEVEAAIGKKDDNCSSFTSSYSGTTTTCTYGDVIKDKGTITVTYSDGKVQSVSKYNY